MIKRTIAIIVAFGVFAAPGYGDETPRTGVIDEAGIMTDSAKATLNSVLLELEQKTGAQFKVWTILSSKGRDLYAMATEKFNAWRLGQKDKNNGCLLLIAVKDRQWRVDTGEGIEDVLPDILCDRIATQYMLPNFRKGDFSQGILLGATAMARAIAGKTGTVLSGAPATPVRVMRRDNSTTAPCAMIFIFFVIFLIFAGSAARRRRAYHGRWGGGFWDALFWSSLLNSGSRGGSSWGGWSSGDSGGFSGGGGFSDGGGGSFGGGGAGGSW